MLNINCDAVVVFTNKLEKLHRSALPVAIRGALNDAAFDVKRNTMPASAKDQFINRAPNFFKANSSVETAKGFDIALMQSTIGFIGKNSTADPAVDDLEQQEYGGTIKSRTFIPTDSARGGSNNKLVRPGNRLTAIDRVVNAAKAPGTNQKSKFVKSAIHVGVGGYLITNFSERGRNQLVKIISITRTRSRGGNMKVRTKSLYSFDKGRSVGIKGTGFMKRASLSSGNKIDDFYIAQATRQVERLMSK